MAFAKIDICNMALGHLGVGREIADFVTDKTAEASACRRFYDLALECVLQDYPWPFAIKQIAMDLVTAEPADSNEEWGYSYRYPADAVLIRRILSGGRNDNRQTRASWKKIQDASGLLIWTDESDAWCEYVSRETTTTYYTPSFVRALSHRLASDIAPFLTGGDPYQLQRQQLQLHLLEISKAQANSANEEQPDEIPVSEFERDRD